MSSSQPSLDLNVGIPGEVVEVSPIWQPIFHTSVGPVTVSDSVMRSSVTALGVANGMVAPRDQLVLARRPDVVAADETQCLSIRAATSVTNLCNQLRAKIQENDYLRAQVVMLQSMLQDSTKKIDKLKQDKKELSRLNSKYEREMKEKLKELEGSGMRLEELQRKMEEEQRKIAAEVQQVMKSQP